MRALIAILFAFTCYSCAAQPNPQSKKVTEKFFQDPNITINTPAFQKKKGYTTYEELIEFITVKSEKYSDLVSISYIGNSQKGKQVPLVILNNKNSEEKKVKVWLQGGLHGNEMGSVESMLYLLDQLLENKEYAHLLNRLTIAMVPVANIDGYLKQDRYAANGLDLNRDQTKLNIQESVFLKQTFSDFGAEVAIDFHEYKPYRKDFAGLSTYGITSIYDAMFLYSGNLNVPENLRKYTDEVFVEAARKKLDKNGLKHHPYVSSKKYLGDIHFNMGSENSRSSASSYALANSISTLIEVRGVGTGRTSFKRRINTAFIIGMSYLETAYNNVDQVKQQLAEAKQSKHQAVSKTQKKVYKSTIQAIDLDKNEEMTLDVTLRDALQLTPMISRERPTAYLIFAEEKQAIEKLKILGLVIQTLSEEKTIEVEKYTVTKYAKDAQKYEGVNRQTISSKTEVIQKIFPKGTALVNLNQAKANLAVEVLEPEGGNSFVSFKVIETNQGATLPVFRYLKPTVIQP